VDVLCNSHWSFTKSGVTASSRFFITWLDLEESFLFREQQQLPSDTFLVQFPSLLKRFDSQRSGVCISCQLIVCFAEGEEKIISTLPAEILWSGRRGFRIH